MGEYLIDSTRVNNAGSNLATFEGQAGSILALHVWNLGPAGTVTTSEESVQKLEGPNRGSGTIVAGNYNGSAFPLKLDLGSYLMIAGSITSMPSVSVAAGSEVYVKAGSIQTYSPLGIGSVRVAEWGVVTPITTTGSVSVYGVGSIRIAEQGVDLGVIGSVKILSNAGSIPVWIAAGSIQPYNPIGVGSVRIAEQGITLAVSGVVNQGTNPWVITGSTTTYGTGSIRISQQGIVPLTVEYYRDTFRFSGATLLTSGTFFNVYTPGAGSKALLKAYTISTDTAMQVRVLFSGTANNFISSFRLPNSGTMAMNLIGVEPSGATDQPIGFGITAPGSVDVSVFVRDTL